MTQSVVTLVVACISAAFSIFSLVAGYFVNRNFEQFKIRLAASQAATERAEDAQRLVEDKWDPNSPTVILPDDESDPSRTVAGAVAPSAACINYFDLTKSRTAHVYYLIP